MMTAQRKKLSKSLVQQSQLWQGMKSYLQNWSVNSTHRYSWFHVPSSERPTTSPLATILVSTLVTLPPNSAELGGELSCPPNPK